MITVVCTVYLGPWLLKDERCFPELWHSYGHHDALCEMFLLFQSRLGDTSRFVFTLAYTRLFWLLEGVSTVKIFSSENQVRLIWFRVIRFFRRLHAFSRFSLSRTELHGVETLSCKSFFAILTTEECEIPVSLVIARRLLSLVVPLGCRLSH